MRGAMALLALALCLPVQAQQEWLPQSSDYDATWLQQATQGALAAQSEGGKGAPEQQRSDTIYALVSLSMPDVSLKRYIEATRRLNLSGGAAVLVFRGVDLEAGAFRSLLKRLHTLSGEEMEGVVINIDPTPFRDLGIDAVPVFLGQSDAEAWHILTGEIRFDAALRMLRAGQTPTDPVGQLYPVDEPDMVALLEERALGIDMSELHARARQGFNRSLSDRAYRLPTTSQEQTYVVNPAVIAQRDFLLPDGSVAVAAGEEVNPLQLVPLTVDLAVIDADNDAHWSMVEDLRDMGRQVVISTTTWPSSPDRAELMGRRAAGFPVTLVTQDLVDRLRLRAVPSLVTQEGALLRVHVGPDAAERLAARRADQETSRLESLKRLLVDGIGWVVPVAQAQSQKLRTITTSGAEDMLCPTYDVLGARAVTKICWECLFPIRIAGIPLGDNSQAPPGRASQPVCVCWDGWLPEFGVTVGMWQPTRIIETQVKPYCFSTLGGRPPGVSALAQSMNVGKNRSRRHATGEQQTVFAHVHYYSFPLLTILGFVDYFDCIEDGISSMDLMWISEVLPQWSNESLAAVMYPETALFANPAAMAANPVDCSAATLGDGPIDKLFWVAGCWGSLYPKTGRIAAEASPVRATSLLSTRFLSMLARMGVAQTRMGDATLCGAKPSFRLIKSQYRMQMLYPFAESQTVRGGGQPLGKSAAGKLRTGGAPLPVEVTSGKRCCHKIGESTFKWGEWRTAPGSQHEDALVYLLWQWVDCCVTY